MGCSMMCESGGKETHELDEYDGESFHDFDTGDQITFAGQDEEYTVTVADVFDRDNKTIMTLEDSAVRFVEVRGFVYVTDKDGQGVDNPIGDMVAELLQIKIL